VWLLVVDFSRLCEYRFVIQDSIAGGMYFGCVFAAPYPNVDASTERGWLLQSLTPGVVAAAFSFEDATDFWVVCRVFSRLILDSIDDGV
jgi:hypothetical protein